MTKFKLALENAKALVEAVENKEKEIAFMSNNEFDTLNEFLGFFFDNFDFEVELDVLEKDRKSVV